MQALRLSLIPIVLIASSRAVFPQPGAGLPSLISATYWGGSSTENFAAVAVDAAGNVYVAGETPSADFPRTITTLPALGSTDVFVSKFDASGALVFSTVFGGSLGERVSAIAVDSGGNIIVAGSTVSADLPVVNPIQPEFHPGFCGEFGAICGDGFVAKLDPTGGSLLFSTYLGTPGSNTAADVAVDGTGNIYVVGTTDSTFSGVTPIRGFAGTRDAFVGKIPPTGRAFTYFTYLGGTFEESGNGIAADAAGNAYVTGETGSQNFPTLNPIQAAPRTFPPARS